MPTNRRLCRLQYLQYTEGCDFVALQAHARRKFIESRLNDEDRSDYALEKIQQWGIKILYALKLIGL